MKKRMVKISKQLVTMCLIAAMLLGITPPISVGAATPDFANPSSVTADWMVHYMGRGTNLGNTFEMVGMQPTDYASVKSAMDAFIAAGFTSVRIPINWGGRETQTTDRADALGNVNFANTDVQTIKKLLDYVLYDVNPKRVLAGKTPIILIINTHHEDWSMSDLIGTTKYTTNMMRLEKIWAGICELTKDYPDTLMYELYNEPHMSMNTGDAARLSVVDMTKRFYNVIRNYTANNVKPHQYRKILFGGYNYNSSWGLWDTFRTTADLPGGGTDKYIIGTFHFYNEIEIFDNSMNELVTNFQDKYDIPVHMGEFGVDHRGVITNTVKQYYRLVGDGAIARNFAISLWDDNGWFGVYDRVAGTWNALKDEALGNKAIPTPPEVIPATPIALPGQLEVESYSAMNGFQTEVCTDVGGGMNVGYTDPTDWLDYFVNVQTAGSYTVEFRLSGVLPTGTLQLQKAGAVLATVTPPNTGAWQTWQTVTATVNLTAGEQTLRLYSTGSQFNINWVKFTPSVQQVATPVLSLAGGTYTSAQTVAITCATAGSTIRYTTDGTTPSATSPIYTAPINVAATTTLKAIAIATGMTNSAVATATYTIDLATSYLIPGQIEAENYSAMFGFQTQDCAEGGLNVGYTNAGDWLDYAVNVETAGTYTVELRMAGLNPIGTLQLQKAGAVLATITPPNTGAWQTWQTVTVTVNLTAGQQTLRLYSTGSAFNINWIKFTNSVPVSIQVEAESYSAMFGIQTGACTDNNVAGVSVGYFDPNDWLDYSVNIPTAGAYKVQFRIAADTPTGTLQLQKAGVVLGTITPPNTGGWDTWQTVEVTVNLAAGQQTLRVNSTGSRFNLNWIKFVK